MAQRSRAAQRRSHTRRRFRERFGLDMRAGDYKRLMRAIKTGRALYLSRSLNGQKVRWVATVCGIPAVAVQCASDGCVSTIYPLEGSHWESGMCWRAALATLENIQG